MPLGLTFSNGQGTRVLIGVSLGSNLGDRLLSLRAGRTFLFSLQEGSYPPKSSSIYETTPVDCPPDSPSFLNAVIEIEAKLKPKDLLDRLAVFERNLGRPVQREQNTPRPLDLDILYAGNTQVDTPSLILPHPRMTIRRFVLQPLADIHPELILPGQTKTITQILQTLPKEPSVLPLNEGW